MKKIVFHKTHKCASSSIQNLLLRSAIKRNLNVVVPLTGNYVGRYVPFHRSTMWGSPWAKAQMSYDLFCLHNIWNYPEVNYIMGGDRANTAYFSILRDPVELFISLWDYAQFPVYYGGITLEQYILKDKSKGKYRDRNKIFNMGRNQMLFDFGLSSKDFDDVTKVQQKITESEQQFDLILVAEQFDESIILLKDFLCWSYEDMTNFKLNAKKEGTKSVISSQARKVLKEWLKADYMLYDHFNKKFQERLSEFGEKRMAQELRIMKTANDHVAKKCSVTAIDNDQLTGSSQLWGKDMVGFTVNEGSDAFCKFYGISEMSFIDQIRDLMSERADKILAEKGEVDQDYDSKSNVNAQRFQPLLVTKKDGSPDIERLKQLYG